MEPDPTDADLNRRAMTLEREAQALLADVDASQLLAGLGPIHPAGSYVSGLMVWRDLDVMVHVGPELGPVDVVDVLRRAVLLLPGVIAFACSDERGVRSPTGFLRDERFHVPISLERDEGLWRVDLTLWLHDPHTNVTVWHQDLRSRITAEQRQAVLRIKDVWHRRPEYPDEVGGLEIYRAVLDHGVRTSEQFGGWLETARDGSGTPERLVTGV